MKESDLAYCGLNCNKCPVLVATVNNDDMLRRKTAKEWSDLYVDILNTVGIDGLKTEDINCRGCRSNFGVFIGCVNCPIRKCCQEKKFITCASCCEYESCDLLKGFYSFTVHQSAKDNLDRIRMMH